MKITVIDKGSPGVSPITKGKVQQSTGFGYVLIPEGVDRDKFVDTCFRKNRISIIDDTSGNIIHDCYVSREVLETITFPIKVGEKGIPVAWIAQPFQNVPMVIGTFSKGDSVTLRTDAEINFKKDWNKGTINIHGSAKDGSLVISAKGQEYSYIKIAALGNEESVLEAFSNGSVEVTANKKVKVKAFEELDTTVLDVNTENTSGVNITKEAITIASSYGSDGDIAYKQLINQQSSETTYQDCTIKLEDGKATISQGDAVIELSNGKMAIVNNGTGLNDLLTKIVDAIATLTVSTSMGPSGTPLPPTIAKTQELSTLLGQFFNR